MGSAAGGYGKGLIAVAVMVAGSLAFCLVMVKPAPAGRAGERLANPLPLGDLDGLGLTVADNNAGHPLATADLANEVWVASFVFTRCKLSCPRVTTVMKGLQERLAGVPVRFVSITVDPAHDTAPVLHKYANSFGADPARWAFVTGSPESIRTLVRERFLLPIEPTPPEERGPDVEEVAHTSRLALVDRNLQVVGFFDGEDPEKIATLQVEIRRRATPWVGMLPKINAGLNALSTLVLFTAWVLILNRRYFAHGLCMIIGLILSALFLGCYLTYHYKIVGSMPYTGAGWMRYVYYTILLSHVLLAVGMLPFIILTVVRAARRQFTAHAAIARITFPIWSYVSVTGVIVYFLLYGIQG